MKQQPSNLFLDAISHGFDTEEHRGRLVTCSGIWDRVCMEGFLRMFERDASAGKQNRMAMIAGCIKDGLVPGLELYLDDTGHEFVRRVCACPDGDTVGAGS
jgi:hypothetical protein